MSVQVHASWPEELPEGWVRHRGLPRATCGTETALQWFWRVSTSARSAAKNTLKS